MKLSNRRNSPVTYFLLFLSFFLSALSHAEPDWAKQNHQRQIHTEALYNSMLEWLQTPLSRSPPPALLNCRDTACNDTVNILLQALADIEEPLKNKSYFLQMHQEKLRLLPWKNYSKAQQLEWQQWSLQNLKPALGAEQILQDSKVLQTAPTSSLVKTTACLQLSQNHKDFAKTDLECLRLLAEADATASPEQLRDIWELKMSRRQFRSGFFKDKPVVFVFCRTDRNHPCLSVIKDRNGHLVREPNQDPFQQIKLGLSSRGLPYHRRNGDTPSGVYSIEKVMPAADQRSVFGQYRRLILEFVPASTQEHWHKDLLPESSWDSLWWRQAVTARNIGRALFRIHGTQRRNDDRNSPHYTLHPTSGCVASREGEYDGTTFKDQRLLLDELMRASGLPVEYGNETQIFGLLYVINIDNQKKAVGLSDIQALGLTL